jgi:hypothetical protein
MAKRHANNQSKIAKLLNPQHRNNLQRLLIAKFFPTPESN